MPVSAFSSGRGRIESAPLSSPPMYCASAEGATGCGPRGFAAGASPFPLSTSTRPPVRSKPTSVGYHPVGTKPRKRLSPGRVMSTTATVLLSALATSSVEPSGETASAFGVEPGGAFGVRAMPMRSVGRREARSTTHTAFVCAQATNSLRPSFEKAIAFGCSPTAISPTGFRVRGSNTATRAPPQTVA